MTFSRARRLLLVITVVLIGISAFAISSVRFAQAASCPIITTRLSNGISHLQVIALKKFLAAEGVMGPNSYTTYFGPLTQTALQKWQCQAGIVCSGTPASTGYGATGPLTRAALRNCAHIIAPPGEISKPIGIPVVPPITGGGPGNGTTGASCTFNSQTIAHGASVIAYQIANVSVGQQCVSENRTCNNGVLSGSYTNATCNVTGSTACTFNNQSVADGMSVTAYQTATVSYGQTCVSESRTCTKGVLSGSYINPTCAVDTTLSGKPHAQISFGDSEGNPANWPEPVFSDASVPWSTVARNFDSVAFNGAFNSMGDTPFRWMAYSNINLLKGENGFGLYSYLGNQKDSVSLDAVTTMGALLGGSLAGIDYSAKAIPPNAHTVNIVRMIKKYFQSDTGANVFLSNVPDKGGWDWWYDILPNVFACQLADIYGTRADQNASGETSLKNLCAQAAARWYAAVDYLRDGNAVPEFAYQAVQLTSGVAQDGTTAAVPFQPMQSCGTKAWDPHIQRTPHSKAVCLGFPGFDGHVYESDASAGLAYLGLYDYLKNGTASGRQMAEWGLTFLDNITYNPFYEILLPYGAIASARMNATEGTNHNTKKILGYVFSESTLRPYWGMLGVSWSGSPVYGLMAARKQSYLQTPAAYQAPSYAFAMNTMGVAITLAPIPRYEEQFAVAIGKYLAHVSHNARYFYPQYAPYKDTESANYIAAASESSLLSLSLPFEGIQSVYPGKVTNEPFATGDPVANGWGFKTNLGVYSGIYSGGMAAIMYPTNVTNIYQIDTLATDFPKPNAYPTYLFYNPYASQQSVEFDLGLARARDSRLSGTVVLYDLVSNKVVNADAAATKVSFTIPSHQAMVIAAVPKTDELEVYQGKVRGKSSSIIIDYHWQQ